MNKTLKEIVDELDVGIGWQLKVLKHVITESADYDAVMRACELVARITGSIPPGRRVCLNASIAVDKDNIKELEDLLEIYKID